MKPMLAATIEDLSAIKYPVYASPKLDGIRCLVTADGRLVSRSLKPIPNKHVNKLFGRKALAGLDGELISGSPTAKDVFRVTTGDVRREDGEPDVGFYVFDIHYQALPFEDRMNNLLNMLLYKDVVIVPHMRIADEAALLVYEKECLDAGYEGLILRSPKGLYKYGRSTMKEQGMMKLKRFVDGEIVLLGVEEEMENTNEAKKNELGRTARSSAREGLVGKGRAGTLVGMLMKDGKVTDVKVRVGTGMTDADKAWYWKYRKALTKKPFYVKIKWFAIGDYDVPRFPVYTGPRERWDL